MSSDTKIPALSDEEKLKKIVAEYFALYDERRELESRIVEINKKIDKARDEKDALAQIIKAQKNEITNT